MEKWKHNGRPISAGTTGKVELVLNHEPDAVIISSNPRLHVPNFDRCRRDNLCRCRSCKPSLAVAS